MDQGTLRYELKVPLAKTTDHPYAIGTAPGKTIGIGLETPKPERSSSGGGGRGNGGGGYGGGGYGGHGGGVGGHGGMHGGVVTGKANTRPPNRSTRGARWLSVSRQADSTDRRVGGETLERHQRHPTNDRS
jgi:hypothetical protein